MGLGPCCKNAFIFFSFSGEGVEVLLGLRGA